MDAVRFVFVSCSFRVAFVFHSCFVHVPFVFGFVHVTVRSEPNRSDPIRIRSDPIRSHLTNPSRSVHRPGAMHPTAPCRAAPPSQLRMAVPVRRPVSTCRGQRSTAGPPNADPACWPQQPEPLNPCRRACTEPSTLKNACDGRRPGAPCSARWTCRVSAQPGRRRTRRKTTARMRCGARLLLRLPAAAFACCAVWCRASSLVPQPLWISFRPEIGLNPRIPTKSPNPH